MGVALDGDWERTVSATAHRKALKSISVSRPWLNGSRDRGDDAGSSLSYRATTWFDVDTSPCQRWRSTHVTSSAYVSVGDHLAKDTFVYSVQSAIRSSRFEVYSRYIYFIDRWDHEFITVSQKHATRYSLITFTNDDRFSKCFYCRILHEI